MGWVGLSWVVKLVTESFDGKGQTRAVQFLNQKKVDNVGTT